MSRSSTPLPPVAPRSLLLCVLALAVGCADTVAPDIDNGEITPTEPPAPQDDSVLLEDEDGVDLQTSLEVEQIEVAAGVDVKLDWSGLEHDLWGQPLEPLVEAQRAALYHFTIDELDEVLEGIAAGTLPQSVLDMQVHCESETCSCHLSEFSFMVGHELDVVGRFEEGDGTWLLAVQSNDGGQDLAYLSLVPVDGSAADEAYVTDDSSGNHVDGDMDALQEVLLERGEPMVVDWSQLSIDSQGQPLDPLLLDGIAVARVTEGALQDSDSLFTQLHSVAEELWMGAVPNASSSYDLVELEDIDAGVTGFPGPDGTDPWLLMLGCSTCGDPLPRFGSRLAWAELDPGSSSAD